MQRLRSTWLALIGGAILVTLSVSAAFGSAPSASAEGTRGQTIAGFVHGLLFDGGTLDDGEDPEACDLEEDAEDEAEDQEPGASAEDVEECEAEESGCDVEEPTADAPAGSFGAVLESEDCDADEDGDEEEQAGEADSASDGTHGACVSEVARDKDAVGGKNDNHGGAVSEAARVTCHEDGSEEAADEAEEAETSKSADKAAAKEQRKSEREADKAARKAEKAEERQSRGHDDDDGEDD
ncbi:MAG: hypothetical protein ACR2K4_03265 [Candidatus Limnocylindria bacterium]